MKIHNFIQGSTEWHNIRLGKFTASNSQAVGNQGKGLETLCYEKASEILFGVPAKPEYTNGDLERGKELEEYARSYYEIQTGSKVAEVGFCELSEYVGCSPDGLVGDDGLAEIKCKNNANFIRCLYTQKIESVYLWQMQFQLFVTDRQWVDFVVYNENSDDLIIIRNERDEKMIAKITAGLQIGQAKLLEIVNKINK